MNSQPPFINIWDYNKGILVNTIQFEQFIKIEQFEIDINLQLIYILSNNKIEVYDLNSNK